MDARCAFHQNQVATFTCERCGNFGCELCRSLTKGPRCAACFARAQDEVRVLAPAGLDFQQLLRESVTRPWLRRWAVLGLGVLPAVPAAMISIITDRTLNQLGPPFSGGTPPDHLSQEDVDRLFQAISDHQGTLIGLWLAGVISTALVTTFCTALFATGPLAGGVTSAALRRFAPALVTTVLVQLAMGAAAMACCLPVIPAMGALVAAIPAAVLGGLGPFAAVRSSIERVLPQLWTVVGVELMLWSLSLGAAIVAGSVMRPLEMLLGDSGVALAALGSAYVGTLLETTRTALGVIVFEKLKPPAASKTA